MTIVRTLVALASLSMAWPAHSRTRVVNVGGGLSGTWGASPGFRQSAEVTFGWMSETDKTLLLSLGGIMI